VLGVPHTYNKTVFIKTYQDSKSEPRKKCQYSKDTFRKKCQYSKNTFRKKYQYSKDIMFRKKYQDSKNTFRKKYQHLRRGHEWAGGKGAAAIGHVGGCVFVDSRCLGLHPMRRSAACHPHGCPGAAARTVEVRFFAGAGVVVVGRRRHFRVEVGRVGHLDARLRSGDITIIFCAPPTILLCTMSPAIGGGRGRSYDRIRVAIIDGRVETRGQIVQLG
jgi:hypothetical protein